MLKKYWTCFRYNKCVIFALELTISNHHQQQLDMDTNKREILKTIRFFSDSFTACVFSVFGISTLDKNIFEIGVVEQDDLHIYGDWENVGKDISKSYEKFKSEYCQ